MNGYTSIDAGALVRTHPKDFALWPQSSNPDLDYLLAQVAEDLQLTETHYRTAKSRYEAVGRWLGDPGSPFAKLQPKIYPQGSMALGTTVKPYGRLEYDLDLVFEVNGWTSAAMPLYQAVDGRLGAHGLYRGMLKNKNRCLCLQYQGEFHLDIIPATTDLSRGGTSILVPDCKLETWTPSNPKGYAAWFHAKAVALFREKVEKAATEPLPAQVQAAQKPPLAIAVQLMKAARDVMFNGADLAPRSIVLTTLAGYAYTGGTSVGDTLMEVLRDIRARMRACAPQTIEVVNPTNSDEKFSDGFTPERYEALWEYVLRLGDRISELLDLRGEPLHVALEQLFGERPAKTAVQKFAELQKSKRDANGLTYSAAGLGLVTPGEKRVPRNHYFGG